MPENRRLGGFRTFVPCSTEVHLKTAWPQGYYSTGLLVGGPGQNPSENYEFVNWDDNRNPIWMGKCQIDEIDGNQTTKQYSNSGGF